MKTNIKLLLIFLAVSAITVFAVHSKYDAKKDDSAAEQKSVSKPPELPVVSEVEPEKIIRIVDGDTIEIEGSEKVRLIGMDTPETVDPRKPVQCFGKEASAKTKELVLGREVRLEKDVEDRDKYGRLLRYVWIDSKMLNLTLVEEGYAQVETVPPNVKYKDLFLKASRDAREANRGLWAACQDLSKDKSKTALKKPKKKIF